MKKALFLIFPLSLIFIISLMFLSSCGGGLVQEIENIEKASFGLDFVGAEVKFSINEQVNGKSSVEENKTGLRIFKSEYGGPCLVIDYPENKSQNNPKLSYYYLNDMAFTCVDDRFSSSEQANRYDNDFSIENVFSQKAFILERAGSNKTNLGVDKKTEGSETVYTVKVKGTREFVDSITENKISGITRKTGIVYPNEIILKIVEKGGVLQSEETQFDLTGANTKLTVAINVDFYYEGLNTVPEDVKEEYELIYQKRNFLKEVIPAEQGEAAFLKEDYPFTEAGRADCFEFGEYDAAYYDGDGRILIQKKSVIEAYDALSLRKLYTLSFYRELAPLVMCDNGKTGVSLILNSTTTTGINVYSLEDLSLKVKTEAAVAPRVMWKNKLYVLKETAENYKVESIDTDSGNSATIYEITKSNDGSSNQLMNLGFYIDKIHDILFIYEAQGKSAKYRAYNVDSSALLYAYETTEAVGQLYERFWNGDCLRVGQKVIDARTGNISNYVPRQKYPYVIPDEYENYIVYNVMAEFEQYDVIDIVDKNNESFQYKHEYWIYDKHTDNLVLRSNGFNGEYIMADVDLFIVLNPNRENRYILRLCP